MLDTVYAVKNNRKVKGVMDDQDPRLMALRKWVRGLARKSGRAAGVGAAGGLRVSLADLRSAKDKGTHQTHACPVERAPRRRGR